MEPNLQPVTDPGKWVVAQIGAYLLGFVVIGTAFGAALGFVVELGSVFGPVVAGSACAIAVVLPRFFGADCRKARLVQSAWVALSFTPFLEDSPGHPLVPIWLLLAHARPTSPSEMALSAGLFAGLGGVFFVLCYGFLWCVHTIAPERWGCAHVRRAV